MALLPIVVLLLLFSGCRLENPREEPVQAASPGRFIHNQPPSRSVPLARLVEPESAAGQLLAYTWKLEGRLRILTPGVEVKWPSKLSLRDAKTAVVRLSTGVMPVRIWTRFFGEVGRNGIPRKPLKRFACEPQTAKEACSLIVAAREDELFVTTPVPTAPALEAIVLYAAWYVPMASARSTPEYSASWGFRIKS